MLNLIIIIYMVLNYAELSSGTVALFITSIVIDSLMSWDYINKKSELKNRVKEIEFQDKLIKEQYRKIDLLEREKLNYLTKIKK